MPPRTKRSVGTNPNRGVEPAAKRLTSENVPSPLQLAPSWTRRDSLLAACALFALPSDPSAKSHLPKVLHMLHTAAFDECCNLLSAWETIHDGPIPSWVRRVSVAAQMLPELCGLAPRLRGLAVECSSGDSSLPSQLGALPFVTDLEIRMPMPGDFMALRSDRHDFIDLPLVPPSLTSRLRRLSITGWRIVCWDGIEALPHLEELEASYVAADLGALERCPALRRLRLQGYFVSLSIGGLRTLTLEDLDLEYYHLIDAYAALTLPRLRCFRTDSTVQLSGMVTSPLTTFKGHVTGNEAKMILELPCLRSATFIVTRTLPRDLMPSNRRGCLVELDLRLQYSEDPFSPLNLACLKTSSLRLSCCRNLIEGASTNGWIESLHLDNFQMSTVQLEALARIPSLRRLRLEHCLPKRCCPFATFAAVASKLAIFEVVDSSGGEWSLGEFRSLAELVIVRKGTTALKIPDLSVLAGSATLTKLHLEGNLVKVSNAIATMPRLRHVTLLGVPLVEDLSVFHRLQCLESVELSVSPLVDAEYKELRAALEGQSYRMFA